MKARTKALVALALACAAHGQTPAVNAVLNSGSYASAGIAPGSIASLFGANLAAGPAQAGSVPLPVTLGTVASVTFNGIAAPLYFVSPGQINVQVPWNLTGGTASVVVATTAGVSAPLSVPVLPAVPGIFTVGANGIGQAIATDLAGGAIAAAAQPIQIGSYLIIWSTGLGAVDAPLANGANTGGAIVNTVAKPTVLIGGVTATPVSSALSPQYPGEYQVAVQVAPGTPAGSAVTLQIQIAGVTSPGNVTIAVAGSAPAYRTPRNVCALTSTGCAAINLSATDPFSTAGAFGGYADATIRQDPLTGTLWMAYSWPHTIPSGKAGVGGTQVLDTHVAYSTDGGQTWTYKGALYTSQPVPNPVTGATDYSAHEVMNLLPEAIGGVTWWYGIHATYNVAPGGAGPTQTYTKRWEIAMAPGTAADGPMALASAVPQYLGESGDTYPQYWPVAVNLSSLHAEVNACTQFYEPALILQNANLYLFLSCTPAGNSSASNYFYAVFKTADPQDNASNWSWTYIPQGAVKFANQSDAVSAGSYISQGATYITQMDLAPSRNPGILLAILTAAYNNAQGKVSLGCLAAELANVDPPRFVYNSQGQVQVDAFLTSPDSEGSGPGSCTYSPFSATGMILAHRQSSQAPQNGGFFTFLMQSLLFP